MTEERLFKLQKNIMDLCVLLHTELTSMVYPTQQDDAEESFMSLGEVLGLDVSEAIQHITEAVKDLLRMKRDMKLRKEYGDYQCDDQYQKALQKLEHEVRTHIKVHARQIEQQLKLLVESTQAKLEDCEKAKAEQASAHRALIEQLKKEGPRPHEPLKHRQSYDLLASARDTSGERRDERCKLTAELRLLKISSKQDASRITDLERKIKRLETDRSKQPDVSHSRKVSKENVNDLTNTSKINDLYRRKYEEKCSEVALLERKVKQMRNPGDVSRRDIPAKSPLKDTSALQGSKTSRRLSDPPAERPRELPVERLRKEKARPMSSTTLRQYVMKQ